MKNVAYVTIVFLCCMMSNASDAGKNDKKSELKNLLKLIRYWQQGCQENELVYQEIIKRLIQCKQRKRDE